MSTGRAPSAAVAAAPAGPGAVSFVGPRCRAALSEEEPAVLCGACGARYPRPGHAYADFAGAEAGFDDWWAQSTVEQHRWLAEEAPREEEYEVGLARRFLMPLLARLDFRPGERALLSAGCGLAADVDALNDAGFHTFGIDCGNRVLRWSARRYQARLARAHIRQVPFVEPFCRATGDVESTQPLPIRGFFSWTRRRHYVVVRPLLPAVDWLLGSLPPAVYGSALCPFWIILFRRRRTR